MPLFWLDLGYVIPVKCNIGASLTLSTPTRKFIKYGKPDWEKCQNYIIKNTQIYKNIICVVKADEA